MKRAFFSAASILIGVIGVACSDGTLPAADYANPPRGDAATPPVVVKDGSKADAETDSDSGNDGGSDSDAATGDLDAGADADAAPWVPGDSLCKMNMTLDAPSTVAGTKGEDRFGAVTPDELTIAWVVQSGNSQNGDLQIADRLSTAGAFGAPQSPSGKVALDGVALSADGLTLVAISSTRHEFAVFTRGARTESFAAADASQYAKLVAALGPQDNLGDPVFAQGGQMLVYSVYGTSSDTVRYALRLGANDTFDLGGPYAYTELRTQNGKRRRPTGVGRDTQTMFYWDEVSGTQKLGRLQGTAASSFYQVHNLGARPFAQPNADCSRIYYGAAGAGGNDIVAASVQ